MAASNHGRRLGAIVIPKGGEYGLPGGETAIHLEYPIKWFNMIGQCARVAAVQIELLIFT